MRLARGCDIIWGFLAFGLLGAAIGSRAGAAAQDEAKCLGIVLMHNQRVALLRGGPPWHAPMLLGEGQRYRETEVLKIKGEQGLVEVRTGTNRTELKFGGGTAVPNPGLAFEDAQLDQLLSLYQDLKQTTLLRHPSIPKSTFTFRVALPSPGRDDDASAVTYAEIQAERQAAVQGLERAFGEKELALVSDGEKFTMVLPKAKVAEAMPGVAAAIAANRWGLNAERIPLGMVDFRQADLRQVAQFYAELVNRTLVPNSGIPHVTIALKNHQVLTILEVVYALDTLFRWNGIQMSPLGTDQATLTTIEVRGRGW